MRAEPSRRASRPVTFPAVVAGGLLAVRHVTGRWLPDGSYVPVNVAVGAGLVGLARLSGSSWQELGLGRRNLGRAVRLGALFAVPTAALMALGAAVPLTRSLFDDERVEVERGTGELLYQTLVRIPIGTVAFEEIAFRSVLLALLARRMSVPRAVVVNSALFGLWHILPTVGGARANGVDGPALAGAVAGAVLVTAAAGVLFCALRLRGGHVVAPMLLHLATNDTGFLLAWWVRS
jgi:uncharacterized protein